ncbi:hypothetical protein GQ43DRAFT_429006 [Delitschia confertaspora ATCC 74209]|uniref:Uncharacterized protein n=1 Tax=Delitschia confertaspora ATCC 74209 TaxID=1513339 RepID=A0A9P4JWA8_9PLEO|nr:hypothetical protein GQ43DRAFT_429006 [Delitschia confertaspora ATCC 74209]
MFPLLQPSRPKHPQQSPQINHVHQQTREVHQTLQYQAPSTDVSTPSSTSQSTILPPKLHSRLEVMPPFAAPPQNSMFPLAGSPAFYNSAVRHPVFFTPKLKKPPFPIPHSPSQGFNPVASGYIMENRKPTVEGAAKTKL